MRAFACLALTLLGATAPSPSPSPQFASIAAAAARTVASGSAKSIAFAVVQNGAVVAVESQGDAGPDTAYNIASVTKMFTAVSVLQLVDAGKLTLDSPIARFYPAFPRAHEITIRELLDHTSGIHNYLDEALSDGTVNRRTTPDAILTEMAKRPLDFPPGTKWGYSNTNYVMLGRIVERVSGQSLERYESEHIYRPAGMTHTAMGRAATGTSVAGPFGWEGARAGDASWYFADGDILSTAADLARFDVALMNGSLVSAGSFAEMQRTAPYATLVPEMRAGLGVFVYPLAGADLVGHHGGEPGYTSDNELVPARRAAYVFLANGKFAQADLLGAALLAYDPQLLVRATSAPPAASALDPDPALTARLQRFVVDLQRGVLDSDVLSPDVAGEFTQNVGTLQQSLRACTALQALQFRSAGEYGGYHQRFYHAACDGKSFDLRFVLDNDQQLEGLFFV